MKLIKMGGIVSAIVGAIVAIAILVLLSTGALVLAAMLMLDALGVTSFVGSAEEMLLMLSAIVATVLVQIALPDVDGWGGRGGSSG